jgi:hypothetical protein
MEDFISKSQNADTTDKFTDFKVVAYVKKNAHKAIKGLKE